jgi:tetratricopeptide (TPR) repeat protein
MPALARAVAGLVASLLALVTVGAQQPREAAPRPDAPASPSPAPRVEPPRGRRPPALLVQVSDETPARPLRITRADVRVRVHGLLAETTTTLTFRNDHPRALAGDLVFPLPPGASVSGYALDVAGEMAEGVIVAAREARVAFERETRKGVDPGLVEWVQGSNFRTRVWPIPARGTRTVRVSFVSDLVTEARPEGVAALYALPLRFDAPLDEFDLEISVLRGTAPEVRSSSLANFRFERFEQAYVARAARRDFMADEDVVVALPGVAQSGVTVESDDVGETYFVVDDFPARPGATPAASAKRVALFWDASLSRCQADRERELGLLGDLFRRLRDAELDVVVFRDVPEPARTFALRSGGGAQALAFLRAAPCDGGTALGALRLSRPVDFALLVSDGLNNLGDALPSFDAPLYALTGDARADHALLRHLAERGGGAFFDLSRQPDEEVLSALGRPAFAFLGADYDRRAVADLLPEGGPVSGARFSLAGRLLTDEAVLTLRYGQRGGAPSFTRTVRVRRAEGRPGTLVGRAWAQRRVAALGLFPERHHDELLRLGRRFGIVTPGASLLVLETLEQHLEYQVEPPASRAALRQAYLERVRVRETDEKARRAAQLERVVEMWRRRVEWWQRDFGAEVQRRQELAKQAEVEARRTRGDQPAEALAETASRDADGVEGGVPGGVVGGMIGGAPAPAAPAASRLMAREEGKSLADASGRMGAAGGGASIVLKPWDPDTPYLRALAQAGRDEAYAVYLAQRETFGASPAFFLDCADHFLRAGRRDLALRVLTSVVELELREPRLLRVAAHRLRQIGALDLAVELFEQVKRLRPEEPQSLRDLALALEARADAALRERGRGDRGIAGSYERAVELLRELALGAWDGRFPEIEVTAIEEANRILAVLERDLAFPVSGLLDERLRGLLDTDLRIVLTWDTDSTDMDLWVTEPSGEKCYYGHALTAIGGLMSRDFTGGYGPEEYLVRRALRGEYRVQANFYASRSATLTGPTTLQATVITNWGRPNEERRALTLRLAEAREVVDIGRVQFDPQAAQVTR